jgi:hypothetical protein
MKEIIIRRNIYDETKEHKLVETDTNGEWLFVPAEDWMPVYLNYDSHNRGETIVSLDSDGFGSPLYLGDTVRDLSCEDKQPDKVVKKIYFKYNVGYIVVLEDANKR